MNQKTALVLAPPFWPNLPGLNLIHLGSFLLKNGIDVDIFDLNNLFFNLADKPLKDSWLISCNFWLEKEMPQILNTRFPENIEEKIEELSGYAFAGFSCFRSNMQTTIHLAKALKARNRAIKIIFGGPEISRLYFKNKEILENEFAAVADCLVAGEGEAAFYDFASGKAQGKLILFEELEVFPEINNAVYQKIDREAYLKKNSSALLFGCGCIRQCRFCSERLLYKKFKVRGIDAVIKQIDYLLRNRVNDFIFHDSMINADLRALEGLCSAIIKNFGKINWQAQMSVRTDMSENLFAKIKQSGCYNIFVGLESGSDRVLKMMHKGFDAEAAKTFFEKLKKTGLSFGVSLIVGFPGEREADFEESLDFLIRNKNLIPKIEQINPFVYYQGTNVEGNDYRGDEQILEKTKKFISRLKENKFKMTRAFLNNLVGKTAAE